MVRGMVARRISDANRLSTPKPGTQDAKQADTWGKRTGLLVEARPLATC